MAARNTQGGTVLAGTFVASATVSTPITAWAGQAAFAGIGGFAETAKLLMRASSSAWAATGNLTVDGTTWREPIQATAAFAGAGSLVANTIHFSAGIYDETGAATLSVSANAFTELEFGLKLDYDNLTTGDVLNFRIYKDGSPLDSYLVTPTLIVPAHDISAISAFAGVGSLTVDSTVLRGALEGAAALAGIGSFDIVPALQMMAQGTFIGAGLMDVNLTKLAQTWQGEAAFSGVGNLVATPKLNMAALAALSGSGSALFAGASIRIIIGRPPGEISDIMQGAGNLAATAKLFAQTQADFVGVGSFSITPQEWMAARASFAGAGSLVANLTKLAVSWSGEVAFAGAGNLLASSTLLLAAQAAFAGVGSYSVSAQMRLSPSANYAGAGSFSATVTQQLMAAQVNFSGVGSLVVNILQLGKIFETAAFLGAGAFIANTRQWMMASAAYIGEGFASITPRLRMVAAKTTYTGAGSIDIQPSLIIKAGARATFSGIGNQAALAFLLCNVSAKYAGVGNMVTTPRLLMDAGGLTFAGIGSFIVTAKQRMMVTGTFGAEGNFDISPALRMRAFASYSGEGSMVADLTPPIMVWTGQATFAGDGALSALGTFDLAAAASMEAVGNLSADTIRFINLSEQFFAGTGSFIVGDIKQILGGFANYGGQGYLTVATMMTSARDYWLVCSGITLQPEILGDGAMAAAIAGSFELTPPLDGKPAVREC